jgi:membrane protein
VAAGFGAASAIVGMMVWIYAAAQVFLYGAELTWLLSQRRAKHVAALCGAPTVA